MSHFPDHRELWAGPGNNPPPNSSVWKEMWAINTCLSLSRLSNSWKDYCNSMYLNFNHYYP